jgi:hypothetical protein
MGFQRNFDEKWTDEAKFMVGVSVYFGRGVNNTCLQDIVKGDTPVATLEEYMAGGARAGNAPIVTACYNRGADGGVILKRCLVCAAVGGHTTIIDALIERGAKVDSAPIMYAAGYGNMASVEHLAKHGFLNDAAVRASRYARVNVLRRLITLGADDYNRIASAAIYGNKNDSITALEDAVPLIGYDASVLKTAIYHGTEEDVKHVCNVMGQDRFDLSELLKDAVNDGKHKECMAIVHALSARDFSGNRSATYMDLDGDEDVPD